MGVAMRVPPTVRHFASSAVCFRNFFIAMAEKKFSLVKAVAGNKRPENSQQSIATKKIPKVSELTPMEPRPQKITTNAPVVVCVYPVSACGIHTWSLRSQTKLVKSAVIVYVRSRIRQSVFREIPHFRTDCAGDLWAAYKDTDEKLYQIQVALCAASVGTTA